MTLQGCTAIFPTTNSKIRFSVPFLLECCMGGIMVGPLNSLSFDWQENLFWRHLHFPGHLPSNWGEVLPRLEWENFNICKKKTKWEIHRVKLQEDADVHAGGSESLSWVFSTQILFFSSSFGRRVIIKLKIVIWAVFNKYHNIVILKRFGYQLVLDRGIQGSGLKKHL